MRPDDDSIDCGIVIPGVYDGISVWRLKDGSLVNRWSDVAGQEHRAAWVQKYIESGELNAVRDGGESHA